jgi:hypothetical protein
MDQLASDALTLVLLSSCHAGWKGNYQTGPRMGTVVQYREEHLCVDGPEIGFWPFLFNSFGVSVVSALFFKRFSLIKKKRVGHLIIGKPAKNRYKHSRRSSWNTTIARAHAATLATKRRPHTHHYKRVSTSRLPASVIVITPPRASDSDFTEEWPPRKTSPQWPHEACVGLWHTDDSSHRRLAAPVLTMSSEKEICKTRAEEDHHDRTARHNVRIRPHIDHMKLDEKTWRLLLSPSVRIARSKLFLFISVFLQLAVLQNSHRPLCINTRPTGHDSTYSYRPMTTS